MGKVNYSYAKRQQELKKQKKRQEKLQRKQDRKLEKQNLAEPMETEESPITEEGEENPS
ncbi:MAG: hypothetical protein PQJ59_12245 [Spirochaetales bacterium]|nr:hypothetical protein [Spirochaetales bacterium]